MNCKYRLEFLRNQNNNDIIPDFFEVLNSKNHVFSEQAVHSFQPTFLRKEKSRAEKGPRLFAKKHGEDRDILRKDLKEILPSIIHSISTEMSNHSELICMIFHEMLMKLSERHDSSLRNGSHINVVTIDGIELPKLVLNFLSPGPKHPFRDNFKEVHFFADVDRLVRELREKNTDGKKLCEIESSAKWYAKNVRETLMDRRVENANELLKDQNN